MRSPDQLVAALRAVAERDDAVSREAVYTSLLDSSLFLPAEPGDDTEARTDGLHLFTTPPDADGVLPAADPDDVEELELAPGAEVLVAPLQTPPGEAFLGVLTMALGESGL